MLATLGPEMLTVGGVVSILPLDVDAAELLPAASLTTADTRNGPSEEAASEICAVAVPAVSVPLAPLATVQLKLQLST